MQTFEPVAESRFRSFLRSLADCYWPVSDQRGKSLVSVQGPDRTYTLERLVSVGDVADVYLGTAGSGSGPEVHYLVKISRVPRAHIPLDTERKTLTRLQSAAGDTTYGRYLPTLVDSFPVTDRFLRRVNVFRWEPGLYTLQQVHEQLPALDGRHLAWIFNRLLTALGFVHRQGMIHGALVPGHVLVHAADHGLRLVGWGQSVATGQRLRTRPTLYLDWYPPEVVGKQPAGPATDLFLAARCLVYLAGGDPVTNRMPEAVPLPMRRFLATCLLDRARMRSDDAWAVLEDFEDLLRQLYGPPTFHPLPLP